MSEEATQKPSEALDKATPTDTPNERHSVSETQPKPAEARLSLDDLLDKHLAGPEFEKPNHKGIDYNSVLEGLPSDAKKLIQNLRSDYQRKTKGLSDKRKELELREQSLLTDSGERLRKAMELPDDIDLYNPDGLKQYIEAKAAEQLNSLLEPARKKLAHDTRLEQVRRFQAEHPDIENYKDEIAGLIKDKSMSIEDAYFNIKGHEYKRAIEKKNTEIEQYKRAAKEAGFKVSVGTPTSKAKPKFNSAYEAYEWMKTQGKT